MNISFIKVEIRFNYENKGVDFMNNKYGNSIKDMDKSQLKKTYGQAEPAGGVTTLTPTTKTISAASIWSLSISAAVTASAGLYTYVHKCF
ncbi:hypothetical protein V2O00_00960 [Streptococcus pneumoniae]|nr:hypothetical protein [Streptococcus pneumoniae]MDS8957220.1 hypothetical protein [Streptococcus pneumoniae]HEU3955965.1 hypothetical protein [Streptococcus pneumoniae]